MSYFSKEDEIFQGWMVIGAAGAGRLGSRSAGEDSIINDILSDGEPGHQDMR